MQKSDQWKQRLAARYPDFRVDEDENAFFRQWTHTGQFRDHGKPTAVCDLCGNTRLRYHFLVANRLTGEAIWVGSQCVLNFDLPEAAVIARQRHIRKQTEREAQEEITQTHMIAMLAQLQGIYLLASSTEQRRIRWMVGKFQRRGGFSPADLGWLFTAMLASGFQLDAHLFPMILRTKKDWQELRGLSASALAWLTPALTDVQRQKMGDLGIKI